jgi:hypothetical protein
LVVKPNDGLGSDDIPPSPGPDRIVTAGATVSTVKERQTSRLAFPGASIALTKKVCLPSESRGSGCGVPQRSRARASIRHSKVEPASLEPKKKVGVGFLMKLLWPGPPVMLAAGGLLSVTKPLNLE